MENFNTLVSIAKKNYSDVKVYFGKFESTVNNALKEAGDYGRYIIFMNMFSLWLEKGQEREDFFYECLRCYGEGEGIYYSVTADGRQLRIWTKRPNVDRARPEHVDSSQLGGRLLFEVVGRPQTVEMYLTGILRINSLPRKVLANGITFYEKKEEK